MRLNNCPFCNHELNGGDVLDIGRMAFCVHCAKCKAYGPNEKTREAAIEKWNEANIAVKLLIKIAEKNPFNDSPEIPVTDYAAYTNAAAKWIALEHAIREIKNET